MIVGNGEYKRYRYILAKIENIAILLIVISGIANIAMSLTNAPTFLLNMGTYYSNITQANIAINMLLRRMMGFILLLTSYFLYKRMRFAWVIALATTISATTLHIIRIGSFFSIFIFIELLVIIILITCADDFCRESDKISVKKAMFFTLGLLVIIILNTSIGFFTLREHYPEIEGFVDCFNRAIRLLFFMDTSIFATNKIGLVYARFSISLNWACIILGLVLWIKPLVYNPIITKYDRARVYKIVKKYGQNPISYLALEQDKKYFFGSDFEGVIAFAVVGSVAVCCGDMICSEEDAPYLIAEFMRFCKKNNYSIAMINVTDHFLTLYKAMGFDYIKYGEDACFKLSEYNLAGGKVAKVRAAINHANRLEVKVEEYKPKEHRDKAIEAEIQEVSKEWFTLKKSGELAFMVGSIGLLEPYDKRYFIARDGEGKIQGVVVFIPYEGGNGYLADVTRRRCNAPQGIIEKLIYDAFMIFRSEGVEWGSMGLSPLVNIREENVKAKLTTKLFEYIYENLNGIYGFKQLHHAKEKYAPTDWIARYLVYYPKRFTPKIAYAIVRVRIPNSMKSTILPTIKKGLKRKKKRC